MYKDDVSSSDFWVTASNPKYIISKFNKGKGEVQRLSQNYPIQGTSADITKYACVLFFKEIIKHDWFGIVKIVNLVHDEILVECPIELESEVNEILLNSMKSAADPFCRTLPLGASSKSGTYWVH